MRSNGNEGERQNEGEKDDDENCLPEPSQGWFLLPSHKANKPRGYSHWLQQIQLLVEPFGPQSNSRFYNLGQPFGAMTRGIDGGTATGNGPLGKSFQPPAVIGVSSLNGI
jgi:hypothetical protein